jgi:hypothetical protein
VLGPVILTITAALLEICAKRLGEHESLPQRGEPLSLCDGWLKRLRFPNLSSKGQTAKGLEHLRGQFCMIGAGAKETAHYLMCNQCVEQCIKR